MITLVLVLLQAAFTPSEMTVLPGGVLIVDVAIVDPDSARIRPGMDVLIIGDRIAQVSSSRISTPAGTRVVDGRDLFLLPGLVDLHVHTGTNLFESRKIFRALTTAGVTSMRLACLSCGSLKLLKEGGVLAGKRFPPADLGIPRVIARGTTPFTNVQAAALYRDDSDPFYRNWSESGFTFLKVFDSTPADIYADVLAHGVRVEGHVPDGVTIMEALAAGQSTFDHIYDILDECIMGGRDAREGVLEAHHPEPLHLDSIACSSLAQLLAARDVAVVPTLLLQHHRAVSQILDSIGAKIEDLPSPECEFWRLEANAERTERKVAGERMVFDAAVSVVGVLKEHGVTILAGSDTPFPFVLPGVSLHDELLMLHQAGLTPAECLQAATTAAARHYGVDDQIGKVAPNFLGDLILLGSNPLDDLRSTRDVVAVVQNGQYIEIADY